MSKNREADKAVELRKAILREKKRGTSDAEIGQRLGVSLKYIEKIITQTKGINVSNLNVKKRIKYLEPKNFKLETTSVWSFHQRGDWATHSGEYRGNFSPYIPRNIILRYSRPGELVLDMFCGGGTTAIEAKLLGRRCIAADINEKAIDLARENVNFDLNFLPFPDGEAKKYFEPELLVRDARDLSWLPDESIDLICTHPPYANIIQYTDNKEGDLSLLAFNEFLAEMKKVARESFRVLKPGRQCALLSGDARQKKHVVPLAFKLINVYLEAGFYLRDLVIKRQHNCKTTGFWYKKSIENNFLLLAHEYLPIFEKPAEPIRLPKIKEQASALTTAKRRVIPRAEVEALETTTVWIFPENQKDRFLARNIVDRYPKGDKYLCIEITLENNLENNKENRRQVGKGKADYSLIWVKSSIFSEGYLQSNLVDYLNSLKEVVRQFKTHLKSKGYLVIETKDIRFGPQLVPFAKLIVDLIDDQDLWLKEIIVVTTNGKECSEMKTRPDEIPGYLSIVHSYLIVYEKI